jgi:hypothetical protein
MTGMKALKWIATGLGALMTVMSVSCSGLPEAPEKDLGPQSEPSSIPWNRRMPGEGTAAFGGFSGTQ